ncbi:MAG: MotA/TolQ/ExbB proton channel family protein, partial [Curvibacter sp.]
MFSIIQAAGWPIWPLIACSILGLALIIERFLSLKTAKVAPPQLLDEVLTASRTELPQPEVIEQLGKSSALGELLASGLRALQLKPASSDEELRNALESTGRVVA